MDQQLSKQSLSELLWFAEIVLTPGAAQEEE